MGIKPLYYALTPNQLLLASELKAITDFPGFSKEIDQVSIYDYLRCGYVLSPRTIYANVCRLSPGDYLLWEMDSGKFEIRSYWNVSEFFALNVEKSLTQNKTSEEDYLDELDALLSSSVRYHLVSDVPLGAFLSGGVDSSLVVSLMRKVSNTDINTFTIRFLESAYNEADVAGQVAQHLNTNHREFTVTPREAMEIIPKLPGFFDEPFSDKSAIPTYLVCKLASRHVTVALSGDGGDELFAGYNSYFWPEKWGHLWKKLNHLHSFIKHFGKYNWQLPSINKYIGMCAATNATQMFDNLLAIWQDIEIKKLAPNLLQADHSGNYKEPSGADILELCTLLDLKRYLPDDILTKVDRTSMAVSLEARVPLLDHRVVEFSAGIPIQYKRRNGTTKYILRRVLERYIPPALANKPKHGFSLPLDAWLKNDLRYLLDEHLSPNNLSRHGILSTAVVQRIIARFLNGRESHTRVWNLLMLQMWLDSAHSG